MKHTNSAGPTQRQLRVGEQLKHIIAETLQRGDFYTGVDMLTVTEVIPSPDLRQATAYIVSLTDSDISEAIDILNEQSQEFQRAIGKQLSMKFTPRIRFKYDKSSEKAARINALLQEIDSE